jgi:malate dehydrogenase (oxaloacetate-decarboxylating)
MADGRALVTTGSPFDSLTYKGVTYLIAGANNALLYLGLGLSANVARAKHIPDGMLEGASQAIANLVNVHLPGCSLLPQVEDLRSVSETVAVAVVKTAIKEREAGMELEERDLVREVKDGMWQPVYLPIQKIEKKLERQDEHRSEYKQ